MSEWKVELDDQRYATFFVSQGGHHFSLSADEAMGLGTALINAAFPYQASARDKIPLAVRLRDEEGPPLPQMMANHRASLQREADTVQSTHSIGESGACDCPQCISMVTGQVIRRDFPELDRG